MREAVISVSDDDLAALGIDELVALGRSAGLRRFEEVVCGGNSAVVRVEVERPLDEARLDALEYVDRWELVTKSDDGCEYLLSFTVPELSDAIADDVADLVGHCDPAVTDRGATLSFVGPREAIRATVDRYESAGMTPELSKLGAYEGRERPLDRLTDRQREVIQTAFDLGYYEVPRRASLSDLANALGVDQSTAGEHLQRAERNLLTQFLSRSR